jgi:hypothetical protein
MNTDIRNKMGSLREAGSHFLVKCFRHEKLAFLRVHQCLSVVKAFKARSCARASITLLRGIASRAVTAGFSDTPASNQIGDGP